MLHPRSAVLHARPAVLRLPNTQLDGYYSRAVVTCLGGIDWWLTGVGGASRTPLGLNLRAAASRRPPVAPSCVLGEQERLLPRVNHVRPTAGWSLAISSAFYLICL